jgi:hypothetical protein
MKKILRFVLSALALGSAHQSIGAELADYQQVPFTFPGDTQQLIVADADSDGANELIVVREKQIRIYFQNQGSFDFETGYESIEFTGDAIGWDLSTGYNSNNPQALSIVALVDGTRVMRWQVENKKILEPVVVKSDLNGFLTKGVHRLHFSVDINDDGLDDLIIPGAGVLNLYIRNADDSYQNLISVQTEVTMRTSLTQGRLERQTGQSMTIPLMELRDVNNDGMSDLISRTQQRLDVFLANEGSNQHFPAESTYTLDIAAIEESLGEFDIDQLDFSNLTGVLALTHEEILEDVNGDNIDDLLLREGGKVSLFSGTPTGMNFEQPTQVLRSGGNVLSTFLFDEDEDGLKDLWLWRVETVSVGDIFLWLAVSGSVAVEAFIYPNEGDSFARRPTRRLTVNLKFPSVIRLATTMMDITEEARSRQDETVSPNVLADIDAEFDQRDLLVLIDNSLQVFLNTIEPELSTDPFLDGLNYTRERDEYEIDIRSIINNISINDNANLEAVSEKEPDFQLQIDQAVVQGDIIPIALNADDLDDLLVFTQRNNVHVTGILLLSTSL